MKLLSFLKTLIKILIFLLSLRPPCSAQIKIHKSLSVDDGLVYSQVLQIVEDSKGYLWLGTTSGLSRWDGLHFKNFRTSDGLFSDYIHSLAKWDQGMLVGTRNGVNIFKDDRFHPFGSLQDRVHDILVARDGKIYLATDQSGVWVVDGVVWNNINVEHGLASKRIYCMEQGPDDTIYFGTIDAGVCALRKGTIHSLTLLQKYSIQNIRALYAHTDGSLYIGTFGNGLVIYNGDSLHILDTSHGLPSNYINHIQTGLAGTILIATEAGIAVCDHQKIVEVIDETNGLSHNFVWYIAPGYNGRFYLGTDGGGFNVYQPYLFETYNSQTGLPHNTVWSIHETDDHTLYFATDDGFTRYRNNTFRTFTTEDGLCSNIIMSIYQGRDGTIYLGSQNDDVSIFRNDSFKNIDKTHGLTSNAVWTITEDTDGKIYFGTYEGSVCMFDGQRIVDTLETNFGILDKFIVSSYCGIDGSIYFGTDGSGVFKIKNGVITDINSLTGLNGHTVWSIYEDQNNRLFFGTDDMGLVILTAGVPDTIDMRDGLSNNCVLGIAEGMSGEYYLPTDAGVNILTFTDGAPTIRILQKVDGLASNECNQGAYLKDSQGRIWIGTIKGVSCYNPQYESRTMLPPKTHITRMRLFDEDIPCTHPDIPLHFRYNENYIKFDYLGLDLCAPHKVTYNYRLSELDKDWLNTDNRFIQYTNLNDGDYTFEVKSANEWGVWSAPVSLQFSIAAPFWERWWFLLITSIVVLSPIIIYIQSRISRMLTLERLRAKIAADLHDDIGSGLSEISIMSEIVHIKLPEDRRNLVDADLHKIASVARNLIDSMSDIVWLVNPKRDSLYDLISRIGSSYEELFHAQNITFKTDNLESLEKVRLNMEARQHLYLIFKEAINNSLKYSNCHEITFHAHVSCRKLHLQLCDDGIGFDDSKEFPGNGLKNMHERAQKIGGQLHIQSKQGNGTRVTFSGKIR